MLLLAVGASALADHAAYSYASAAARSGFLQTTSQSITVARAIVPSENIVVTQLGYEFQEPRQGTNTVGIFDASTQALVASANVAFEDTVIGTYIYQSITPVTLEAGKTYYLAASVPEGRACLVNVNMPVVGPKMTDMGTYRATGAGLTFPSTTTTVRSSPANIRYTLARTISNVSGLPSVIAPTFRSRFTFPTLPTLNTVSISATVADTALQGQAGVPVTFEVVADPTTAGHNHTGVVYPWLNTTNDDQGRPLTDKVGAAALGGSTKSSVTVNTDASGVATITLTAPEVSGTYLVRATAAVTNTPEWQSVDVKVADLVKLPESPSSSYNPVSLSTNHSDYLFGTSDLHTKIEAAAVLYRQYQLDESKGLPALIRQIAASGYVGKFKVSEVRMRVGDMSLPWGGLFDLKGNLSTSLGHTLHREGKEVDIFVQPFLKSLPTGAITPSRLGIVHAATDDTAPAAIQGTIAKANLLRMRLLAQALLDAGFTALRKDDTTDGTRIYIHAISN